MGITTDLNVDPYYDDFDEAKQFNRILFRPARAVQARELTQMQTILQKQIERFGSNVYKEGTIISGVNLTSLDDIRFVKLKDEADFVDPTIYKSTDTKRYIVKSTTTNLTAEIVDAATGFETQPPNLKTFFIKYLTTSTDTGASKRFTANERLEVFEVVDGGEDISQRFVNVANVTEAEGNSFGVSCTEGVIYQKGHFVFVTAQSIIISKYNNVPDNVSVGFVIKENLINSDQDTSLLDNATGFNNENAPGADRLNLVPELTSLVTSAETEEFFALARYLNGNPIRLRSRTEFNTIADELARRTFDESGNYVVDGLSVRVEETSSGGVNAIVNPGKAYVFGHEVTNLTSKKIPLEAVTSTQDKSNQVTGVFYGQYFTYDNVAGTTIDNFDIEINDTLATRYNIKGIAPAGTPGAGTEVTIGKCSINNVTPGRIYVYGIKKEADYLNVVPTKIQNTVLTNSGQIFDANVSGMIFDTGKSSIDNLSDISVVLRETVQITNGATSITLPTEAIVSLSTVVVSDGNDQIVIPSSVVGQTVNFTAMSGTGKIYYDTRESISPSDQQYLVDTLAQNTVFIKTTYSESTRIAPLGFANVVRIKSIKTNNGDPAAGFVDITSKFKLVNNQKEYYYDLSYMELRAGETISSADGGYALLVEMEILQRSTAYNGFLTANSYVNVSDGVIPRFQGKDGKLFDLKNCYDFRPYALASDVSFATDAAGADVIDSATLGFNITANRTPGQSSQIIATQRYYLSRIDNIVVDEFGNFTLYKGEENENPSRPNLKNLYPLSRIRIPGNVLTTRGNNPIRVADVSNRNYTMKDISNVEKRIDRLIETVSLSLLELKAKDIFIDDGTGANRFKSGILVDSCRNLAISDVLDPEFRAAIDKSRAVITPAVTQYPIDLKVRTSSLSDTPVQNAEEFDDIVTKTTTATPIVVLDQRFATGFRNCVTDFYNYAGKADIFPAFDVGYDVVTNPEVNFDIDLTSSIGEVVGNIQELIPLTREDVSQTTTLVQGLTAEFDGFRFDGPGIPRQTVTETQTQLSSLVSTEVSNTVPVGNFITDFSLTPFVQSREVSIAVTGLRPNTQHYFYFEGTSVNVFAGAVIDTASSTSNIIAGRNVRKASDAASATVTTDANGSLFAVFEIPANTFFVGENTLEIADVDTYSEIESAKTSFANVSYRAYNFQVGRTELASTTRSMDFDIETNIIIERQFEQIAAVDPIAQTFLIRTSQANGATCIYVKDLELFFKKKSSTNGVTIEVREVINGFPSKRVLPFGRKHLSPSQISVSDDSSLGTVVEFENPIKLLVEREYAFVVIPDANDPDYLIFTSQIGGKDLQQDIAITNDWGDGVLFTSTNDRAWKSYQDEDIKFKLRRHSFQTASSYVDLVPNDVEFFTISNKVGGFKNDEFVYVAKGTSVSANATQNSPALITDETTSLQLNSYVTVTAGTNLILAKIIRIATENNQTTITIDSPWPYVTGSVDIQPAVAGRVSYYNPAKPDRLHLRLSTASATIQFATNDDLTGYSSEATATITTVDDRQVSYIQSQILVDNSVRTNSTQTLYNVPAENDVPVIDRSIDASGNVYLLNSLRTINSKSNIESGSSKDSFIIRTTLDNNGFEAVTPQLDAELSALNVYEYIIDDADTLTSSYISREVILEEDFEASGLKVLLSAFRPNGTVVDVYARFTYLNNVDEKSDWVQLTNKDPNLYSNSSETQDYRDYEYDLTEAVPALAYNTFQIKIVFAHEEPGSGVNLFPHLNDYRAIALLAS